MDLKNVENVFSKPKTRRGTTAPIAILIFLGILAAVPVIFHYVVKPFPNMKPNKKDLRNRQQTKVDN